MCCSRPPRDRRLLKLQRQARVRPLLSVTVRGAANTFWRIAWERDRMSQTRCRGDLPGSDWFWSVLDRVIAAPDRREEILSELTDEPLGEFYYEYGDVAIELYPSRTIPE